MAVWLDAVENASGNNWRDVRERSAICKESGQADTAAAESSINTSAS